MLNKLFLFAACLSASATMAQASKDPSYNSKRSWWDLTHYNLNVEVVLEDSSIFGYNDISYKSLNGSEKQKMQIDMQEPMLIDSIIQEGKSIRFTKKDNSRYIVAVKPDHGVNTIRVYFHGKPPVSQQPPWSSGFVWNKDNNGNPWIASVCQDAGASMWWPCKDHPKDEVDSMAISITCPQPLKAVSNGRLISVNHLGSDRAKFTWKVINPINAYGVNLSVGDYAYFADSLTGELGKLDADYYVLPYNVEKARNQFKDAQRTITALEHWFGPYPFYEDGYKLVETPYLGMEHQSCVAYGNGYQNGYRGYDLSGSGWGLKFDFIIIHESGHEWFANSVTNSNEADMWIHEGFTSYSENLFLEYFYGAEAGAAYTIGTRRNIANDKPIIGNYTLGEAGSSDMYYKGANILHMLRTIHGDTEDWRRILRLLNETYFHKTVSSAEVEKFMAKEMKLNLDAFWNQYLRETTVPTLEYEIQGKKLLFKFTGAVKKFAMPVRVKINGEDYVLDASVKNRRVKLDEPIETVETNPNYYINYKPL